MNKDRMFFDPYALAFIKAIVYFLGYWSSIILASIHNKAYYAGVIIYCLGCVGDYIEIAFYKTEKCFRTRVIAFLVAFLIIVFAILSFCLLIDFNDSHNIISTLSENDMYIKLISGLFWASPTICGFLLAITHIKESSNKNSHGLKVNSVGYFVKP